MPLSKNEAFESLANNIRMKYDMDYNSNKLFDAGRIKNLQESTDPVLKKFASVYSGDVSKGGHPDYNYLAEADYIGEVEKGSITAFFFDLKNFTKYFRLLDDKEKVYKAKAASIEAVAAISSMYGGHLHEIPGDGVLIFFGGRHCENDVMALRALYALCDSMYVLENYIIPEYNSDEYPDIYPKMGLDYGEVLWGAYGASPSYEVKATSFNVDIASKMMSYCSSKEAAIGNDIKNFLAIDARYLIKNKESYNKSLTVNGVPKSILYAIWKFDWKKYRNDKMPDSTNLDGLYTPNISITKSRTKLQDAPLA